MVVGDRGVSEPVALQVGTVPRDREQDLEPAAPLELEPAAFRFDTKEVFIDRNPRTGDVILSRKPANWSEVFAALDRAGVPEDLLADRDRSLPQERETV